MRDPLIEERLIGLLKQSIIRHRLKAGNYTDQQINLWEKESHFLLDQLKQLETKDAWWSDPEWEWFINRALDFLEVP